MAGIIKKSAIIMVLALLLPGCSGLDKQLYLYVPGTIDETDTTGYTGSVTVAYPVPRTLSIQLSVSGNGKDRIALNPGGLEIAEEGVTATFTINAIDDLIVGDTTATITATAAGYDSDSVNITIISDDFDKQLYLYAPGVIDEGVVDQTCSVTVAYPVPRTLSIQLSVSGTGKDRIVLSTGGLEIAQDGVTATFTITAIDDSIVGNDSTATITATAAGYTSDSVDITIFDDGDV